MPSIRAVEYFYATVPDQPGEAATLLSLLADSGVELLAFSIVPTGPTHTQLMMFPATAGQLVTACKRAGLVLTGPQHAFLVTGDNELGALVEIHRLLAEGGINVYASSGVTDPTGTGFGYVLYVRPEEFKKAGTLIGVTAKSWRPVR